MLVKDNKSTFQHSNFRIQKKIFSDNNLSESFNMLNSSLFPSREEKKQQRKRKAEKKPYYSNTKYSNYVPYIFD